MALFLKEEDVTKLATIEETIEAVEDVFKSHAVGDAVNVPRSRARAGGGIIQVMSGAVANIASYKGLLGLKAYTVTGRGMRFYVMLFDAETGELLAFIEADKLGQMRTGAASGVATKYMALAGATTVGIYGTGWQARSQLQAIGVVRDIESVKVFSRSSENRTRFCLEMSALLNDVKIVPVETPEAAAQAEIIVTITTARDPVLNGAWLRPGTHINAAGSNSILRREFDEEVINRAALIAVDSLDQSRIEAGELIIAVEKGLLNWERVRELRQVVGGGIQGRKSDDDITLFKSLGIAIEDIAIAAVLYRKAKAQKVGREI